MDAERQPVSGCVDRLNQRFEIPSVVAIDVDDRPKHLTLQRVDAVDLNQCRREKLTVVGRLRQRALMNDRLLGTHLFDVALQHLPRLAVDDRSDIGGEIRRITDVQFKHRALEQFDNPRRDVLLHTENP